MCLIEIKDLTKIYGKNNYETKALNKVSLKIDKGEYIAIMGPSGSGKSTLLNIIGCMDRQSDGKYLLNKKDVSNLSNKQLSIIRNSFISFIFQNFSLMNDYSVYDNVELPLSFRRLSKKKKKEIVYGYLKKLHIEDQAKKNLTSYLGGSNRGLQLQEHFVAMLKLYWQMNLQELLTRRMVKKLWVYYHHLIKKEKQLLL